MHPYFAIGCGIVGDALIFVNGLRILARIWLSILTAESHDTSDSLSSTQLLGPPIKAIRLAPVLRLVG